MFDANFDELLTHHPELRQKYQGFLSTLAGSEILPNAVLSVCRTKVRQIHGLEIDSQPKASNETEEVAMAIAKKMPFQHHDLLDEEVQRAKELFGDKGCVALLTAVAFFDVASRLEQTFKSEP